MSLKAVIASDLNDVIFSTDNFAIPAVHNGTTTVNGLFDNVQTPTNAGGSVEVVTSVPLFRFKTGDITPAEFDTMLISGVTYKIRSFYDDGLGETTLELQGPP